MENQETLDAIVAKMRRFADRHRMHPACQVVREFADMIDFALKRDCEVVVSKNATTTKESLAVGNAAKLREALEAARDLLLPQCNGGTAFAKACGETVNKIMDALSAPPRNCDRFGGDYKMLHTAWFDWTGSPSGQNPDGTVKLTFAEWLLEIAGVRHA